MISIDRTKGPVIIYDWGWGQRETTFTPFFYPTNVNQKNLFTQPCIEVSKLFTQPKEKYHITIIILEKSKVDHCKFVRINAQVMRTLMHVIDILDDEI